jgi:Copper binding proteins, plastocyanin/azurin family
MKGMTRVLILAVFVLLVAAACSGASGAGGGTVNATLTDSKVIVDRDNITAGTVVFTVKNTGTLEHELVVLKTDVAADKIKADADEPGKMSEEGSLGESGDIAAGETKTFSLNLTPGHYVFMCNQPGHYMLGMHIAFTVN